MPPPSSRYLVGRGIADITGECAECGMLGYGKANQQTHGIHLRQRARAFAFVDTETGGRFLLVVAELGLMFTGLRREVLGRLSARYGGHYPPASVMLAVTHTHSGPGGYAHHRLYNMTTGGFRPLTFNAIVDGITEAIERAHRDLGPSTLRLAHGTLTTASRNRSPTAFARDPADERAAFPDGIDPQTTVLAVERAGECVGMVNWFATHGTSMSNRNLLISSDNKGYAAYHWERLVRGVDYRSPEPPAFVAAFAQTNAGDLTPNFRPKPGGGPTDDEVENTRIIGRRQYEAAAATLEQEPRTVEGPIDARITFIDLASTTIDPAYAPDGRSHRTSGPAGGAASIAGTAEGPGFLGFRQGRNPFWDSFSRPIYAVWRSLRDTHQPKGLVLPAGLLNRLVHLAEHVAPVQLVRLGPLYLIGIPGEASAVAGLRLRRTVASIMGADERDVLVAGYANGYIHYVTTPEEYDEQRYEGGSTLFGRWELAAFQQTVATLAHAMRDGRPVPPGPAAEIPRPWQPGPRARARRKARIADEPLPGHRFGEVVYDPEPGYRRGQTVRVAFAGAHPGHDLRRGDSYLEIQRRDADGAWLTVADDGDWATTFRWERVGRAGSRVTVTWSTEQAEPGTYRVRYLGAAQTGSGREEFSGTSRPFELT